MRGLFGEIEVAGKRRPPETPAAEQGPKEAEWSPKTTPIAQVLRQYDGEIECACAGSAFDVIDEDGGYWLAECCYCGTGYWVPAVIEPEPDPGEKEFVFAAGQWAGKTIEQVSAEELGPSYLSWAAEKHPKASVREAVKKWLDLHRTGG